MEDKILYGHFFTSKKALFEWVEKISNEIDWDEGVKLGWYYKNEIETDNESIFC